MPPAPKVKVLKRGRAVTNALGTGGASKPQGCSSFAEPHRKATGQRGPPCFVCGCPNKGTAGGQVKLAPPAAAALVKFDWYVIPACPAHNKRPSCGSYRSKPGTLAVRVTPSLRDRVASWAHDGKKVFAAFLGKQHL